MDFINQTVGKYKLIRLIGEGGMAYVYEGIHERLGTRVAVKILNPVLSVNEQIRNRFENEVQLLASLDHPNIIKVIDYDESPNRLAIIMEYLSGSDLSTHLQSGGSFSLEKNKDLFLQMMSAFKYAHQKGIVHRDIKPSNIFITENGQIKVLDFGIAKIYGTGADMTSTGTQMGTPIYMSPEQVKGDKSIDHRSDIYSLGVTFYTMLNGKPPYDTVNTSQFDIFNQIVFHPLPPLNAHQQFAAFINKAVEKDRQLRYQSMEEMIVAFEQVSGQSATGSSTINQPVPQTGQTPSASSSSTSSTPPPFFIPPRKKPNVILIVLGALVGLSILIRVIFFVISSLGSSFDGGEEYQTLDTTYPTNIDSPNIKQEEPEYEQSDATVVDSFATSGFEEETEESMESDVYVISFYQSSNVCPVSIYIDGVYEGETSENETLEIELTGGKHIVRYTADIDGDVTEIDKFTVNISGNETFDAGWECACPFFYYLNEESGSSVFGGEFIRNQNSISKDRYDHSSVNLEYCKGDNLRLLVTEEKDEVSYLDHIYLLINGKEMIEPLYENAITEKLLDNTDGQYFQMNKGDRFYLTFRIPEHLKGKVESAVVYSKGYYIPLK